MRAAKQCYAAITGCTLVATTNALAWVTVVTVFAATTGLVASWPV